MIEVKPEAILPTQQYTFMDHIPNSVGAGPSSHHSPVHANSQRYEDAEDTIGIARCGGFEVHSDDDCDEVQTEDEESYDDAEDYDSDDDDDDDYVPTHSTTWPADTHAVGGDLEDDNQLPDWVDDDEIDMWSPSTSSIRLGMCFKSKNELVHAIRRWSVLNKRELRVVRSSNSYFKAICLLTHKIQIGEAVGDMCNWRVSASSHRIYKLWQIYKWVDEHNCFGTVVGNNNRNLSSKDIAYELLHLIEDNVGTLVKTIQSHIRRELYVEVSYQKAWRGRRKAIDMIYGTWESNFVELPSYVEALKATNPQTVVEWKHNDGNMSEPQIFKYVFWAFGPAIRAFQRCHPVICVDGTHLKGTYRGKLLLAVTKDANNHILPLAYSIVDEETNGSWAWFMEQFRYFVANTTTQPLCVISDRHKGIINAMNNLDDWKEPHAYHRFCLRHVRSNLMTNFKDNDLKKLCWGVGSASQRRKYITFVRDIK